MKVQNKVIVVTGGGSGMGRELVLQLLSKGAKVIAIDIDEKALKETVEAAHDEKSPVCSFVVDITDKAAVEKFFYEAVECFDAVDAIINNAGIIQPFVRVNELSYETIDRILNVNFFGTLYMVKAFLPHLLTRPQAHIVNVSSMGGFVPVPGQSIYGAAKAAVKLLTEGLHSELRGGNVKVTVVFPGGINTNILKNSGLDIPKSADAEKKSGKLLSASKAAQMVIDAMEKDRYRVLVGKDAKVMDFFYRLNPKSAASMISKKMKGLLSNNERNEEVSTKAPVTAR